MNQYPTMQNIEAILPRQGSSVDLKEVLAASMQKSKKSEVVDIASVHKSIQRTDSQTTLGPRSGRLVRESQMTMNQLEQANNSGYDPFNNDLAGGIKGVNMRTQALVAMAANAPSP